MKKSGLLNFFWFSEKYYINKKDELPSFFSLYKHAEPYEKLLSVIGVFSAILSGFAMPFILILYGEYADLMLDWRSQNITPIETPGLSFFNGGKNVFRINGTDEDVTDGLRADAFAFLKGALFASLMEFTTCFISVVCLNNSTRLQFARMRRKLLKSILSKDIPWHDASSDKNLTFCITGDLSNIQETLGEKMGECVQNISFFFVGMAISFVRGWKLSLAGIACLPAWFLAMSFIGKVYTSAVVKEQKAIGSACSVAEDAFASFKTVIAFNGQQKEAERYERRLAPSLPLGIQKGVLMGLSFAITYLFLAIIDGICLWFGVILIQESIENGDGLYTVSVLIIVVSVMALCPMKLTGCAPFFDGLSAAKCSAASIYKILDTPSVIDPMSSRGKTLSNILGDVRLKGVHFSYPARPDTQVLNCLDIKIKNRTKVAIVGHSGSGKSTIVSLIQRLYDPSKGSVLLDNVDIRELNVSWLRQQIGVVSQEPQLFATTIYENILYGQITATTDEIEKAAKIANAHDFIKKMPMGYQTIIGQQGTQLSGGQKQRIAIARAVLRNPKILLLDEATSALDTSNEAIVQQALDRAAVGRTTIIVAHRLSTIKNADNIIVVSDGKFVESGTHDELIAANGAYKNLVNIQITAVKEPIIRQRKRLVSRSSSISSQPMTEKREMERLEMEIVEKNLAETEFRKVAAYSRILSYGRPEWFAILVGVISTAIFGCALIARSYLTGEFIGLFSSGDGDVQSMAIYYGILTFLSGILISVAIFLQVYCFGYAGSQLVYRLRKMTYAAILKQEPAWFDREENKIGALSARLTVNTADIQGITGSNLTVLLQAVASLIFGLALSFFYSWQVTLVLCACLPIVSSGQFYTSNFDNASHAIQSETMEDSAKVASESIRTVRTIASLGLEQTFLDRYDKELQKGESDLKKKSFVQGVYYAFSKASMMLVCGITICYGGIEVANGNVLYKNVFKAYDCLLNAGVLMSNALTTIPNLNKVFLSAARIFKIIDREPSLQDGTCELPHNWMPKGRVEFSKIKFSYPSRPESEVLSGLSFSVDPGSNIALAGASGCGKSTVLQLLLRFYDPSSGKIILDEHNIKDSPITQMRQKMSIVSQEPVLFDATIAENIAYGDDAKVVSLQDIIKAAKKANIHNFVTSLPKGYETEVGKGGTQLSGGQKQRIAIARALIRNPRILILDEATSALDAASESVVQEALNVAAEGRTTITVGHRTSALTNANKIYVLDKGAIVEHGTHQQLLEKNGTYAHMNS